MKLLILSVALLSLNVSFAESCISENDQEHMSTILKNEEKERNQNPDCFRLASCINPFEQIMKDHVLNKLVTCAKGKELNYEDVGFDNKPCLNEKEQMTLGTVLSIELEEYKADPDCVIGTGAASCLSPFESALQRIFMKELKDCK